MCILVDMDIVMHNNSAIMTIIIIVKKKYALFSGVIYLLSWHEKCNIIWQTNTTNEVIKIGVEDVLKIVKEKEVKFIDYRFTNTSGKEQHVTVTASEDGVKTDFAEGKMFDGSSIAAWKDIESDMILMPDASTAVMDPFYDELNACNIMRCH